MSSLMRDVCFFKPFMELPYATPSDTYLAEIGRSWGFLKSDASSKFVASPLDNLREPDPLPSSDFPDEPPPISLLLYPSVLLFEESFETCLADPLFPGR